MAEKTTPITIEFANLVKLFTLLSDIEQALDEGHTIKPDTEDGCADFDGKTVTIHQRVTWTVTGLNCAIIEVLDIK